MPRDFFHWLPDAPVNAPPPGTAPPSPGAVARATRGSDAVREDNSLRVFRDWRTPGDGIANMRGDEALLQHAAAGAAPTLRLYRWSHPTLTLGHGQTPHETMDPDALAASGIRWIARPTGGRALLHLPDELTYAFAAPRGWASGVRAAYFRVMRSIWVALSGYVDLDPLPAGLLPRDTAPPRLPCQAVATGHEITAGGRKLVVGAQRWRRGAFLQHGSIPWTVDRILTNSLAGLPADSPVGAVGLAELMALQRGAPPPAVPEVAAALCTSFRRDFVRPVLV